MQAEHVRDPLSDIAARAPASVSRRRADRDDDCGARAAHPVSDTRVVDGLDHRLERHALSGIEDGGLGVGQAEPGAVEQPDVGSTG
nr:hypothetical protein [Nocardia higoensis]